MFDYKSPINMLMGKIESDIKDEIFKVTQKYNVVVDEEELLKALKYDRDQYRKGYNDGVRTAEEKERVFENIIVEDYKGKPYYSIIYTEGGERFNGYGSYDINVISRYLRQYFFMSEPEERYSVSETIEK